MADNGDGSEINFQLMEETPERIAQAQAESDAEVIRSNMQRISNRVNASILSDSPFLTDETYKKSINGRRKLAFHKYIQKAKRAIELQMECICREELCQNNDFLERSRFDTCIGRCFNDPSIPCNLKRVMYVDSKGEEKTSRYCEYHFVVCKYLSGGTEKSVEIQGRILGYAHEFGKYRPPHGRPLNPGSSVKKEPHYLEDRIASGYIGLMNDLLKEQNLPISNSDIDIDIRGLIDIVDAFDQRIFLIRFSEILKLYDNGVDVLQSYFVFMLIAGLRFIMQQYCVRSSDYSHTFSMLVYYNLAKTFRYILNVGEHDFDLPEFEFKTMEEFDIIKFLNELDVYRYIIEFIEQNRMCIQNILSLSCLDEDNNPLYLIRDRIPRNTGHPRYLLIQVILRAIFITDIRVDKDVRLKTREIYGGNEDEMRRLDTTVEAFIVAITKFDVDTSNTPRLISVICPRKYKILTKLNFEERQLKTITDTIKRHEKDPTISKRYLREEKARFNKRKSDSRKVIANLRNEFNHIEEIQSRIKSNTEMRLDSMGSRYFDSFDEICGFIMDVISSVNI
jgi:hypothetical protein